jgi:hypothetical protein
MAAWFDSQDYIKRYAPFGKLFLPDWHQEASLTIVGMMEDMQGVNQDNALMNPDGSVTSLGSWVSLGNPTTVVFADGAKYIYSA